MSRALTAVRTIGVELFKSGSFGTCLGNHSGGGIAVLHAHGGYSKGDDQTHRIDDEVSLSTFHLLGSIETALTTLRRSAIGLSVHDSRCWLIRLSHA